MGIVLIIAGLLVNAKILGRLPGDFEYHRGNFHFYFPLASSILISILLTVLLTIFLRK
jgi:hypothetical protein